MEEEKMTREELRELGLTEDQVNSVMGIHGKDVKGFNDQLAARENELSKAKEDLINAKSNIQNLEKEKEQISKDTKIEGLTAEEWKEKYSQAEKDKVNIINQHLLDQELSGLNAHDLEVLKKELDMDKISFNEGKVEGLEDQVTALKESKGFLFKANKTQMQDDRFDPFLPNNSAGDPKSELAQDVLNVFND